MGTSATLYDVLVIGAGPTGLACAIDAQRAGFSVIIVDKGCLCNSLFHYPANMTFFTTPELLEIGSMPFSSPNQKPNRNEALEYYRKVAEHYQLNVLQYRTVDAVSGSDGDFTVHSTDRFGRSTPLRARKLIIATGYYDLPNYLDIPGEDLVKVLHYYDEPHPYFGLKVLVIGGKNSAAIAALDLWRHGRTSPWCIAAWSFTGILSTGSSRISRTASRTARLRLIFRPRWNRSAKTA